MGSRGNISTQKGLDFEKEAKYLYRVMEGFQANDQRSSKNNWNLRQGNKG